MRSVAKRGRPALDAEQAERTLPTRETALKLVPDPLAIFEPALQRIGHEIALIHAALSGRLNARTMKWQEGRAPSKRRDPIDRIKHERVADYLDWLKSLAREHIQSGPVFEMISDLHPPHWVDSTYKLRPGTAAEWLIMSLQLYGGGTTARPSAE